MTVQKPEEILENTTDHELTRLMRSIPRLTLPSKNIDLWNTAVSLDAVGIPVPYFIPDIWNQPTQVQPAIPISGGEVRANGQSREKYAFNLRKLAKNSGVYALSSLASPLVALVLAPFLTRNLSHSDYGALAVISTAITLLAGLTQMGLGSAFFRSYNYDYALVEDRRKVLSTVILLLVSTSFLTAVATIMGAPLLATLLFRDISFAQVIRVAGVVVFLQNLTVPGFSWLRAENKPFFFSVLSLANLLVALTTTLFFIGTLHLALLGSLLATGTGYLVVVMCILPYIVFKAGVRFRWTMAKELLSFGLPNVSTFVSVWVLQLSDRYLLSILGSLAQAAGYSLAYNLGGVLGVVVLSPFTLAWPSAMFSIAKRSDSASVFRVVFRWFSFVLLFAAYMLSLVSTSILRLFFPPAYQASAPIIPVIAMSIMFYGIYNIFMTGVSITRKTWFAVLLTSSAAIINVIANLILIPIYGAMGAAVSTLMAYFVLTVIAYIVNQRIYPIPYEVARFVLALILGIALYVVTDMVVRGKNLYLTWMIYIIVLFFYGGCLALLGRFPSQILQKIYRC